MSFSVVILSKNIQNLRVCVREVRANEPDARIIVVDDGLEDRYIEDKRLIGPATIPVQYVEGVKPFVFSRNANIGIRAAGDDDVILLNDDAILKTPDGFSKLEAVSKAHTEYGVIAPVSDAVGNPNQMVRMERAGLRDEPRMVCFICVYIPRSTINTVGLLDEEFVGYGFDDDSYCLRTRRAGLKIGVYDLCYIDHSTLKSTFRTRPEGASLEQNAEIFKRKYGGGNWDL